VHKRYLFSKARANCNNKNGRYYLANVDQERALSRVVFVKGRVVMLCRKPKWNYLHVCACILCTRECVVAYMFAHACACVSCSARMYHKRIIGEQASHLDARIKSSSAPRCACMPACCVLVYAAQRYAFQWPLHMYMYSCLCSCNLQCNTYVYV
jgi:hypothetical protein